MLNITLDLLLPTATSVDSSEPVKINEYLDSLEERLKNINTLSLASDICLGANLRDLQNHYDERSYKKWLSRHDISAKQAETLISVAETSEGLLGEVIAPENKKIVKACKKTTKQALSRAASAREELKVVIGDYIIESESVVRKGDVSRIIFEDMAANWELLDDKFKEKVANGTIPIKKAGDLMKHLEKIPTEKIVIEMSKEIGESNDPVALIKPSIADAKNIATIYENAEVANILTSIEDESFDIDSLVEEAIRLETTDSLASVITLSQKVEKLAATLAIAHSKLKEAAGRLDEQSGRSTPAIRAVLDSSAKLTGDSVEILGTGEFINFSSQKENEETVKEVEARVRAQQSEIITSLEQEILTLQSQTSDELSQMRDVTEASFYFTDSDYKQQLSQIIDEILSLQSGYFSLSSNLLETDFLVVNEKMNRTIDRLKRLVDPNLSMSK